MNEKLVRDNIPGIALDNGQTVTYRKAAPEDHLNLLWLKLEEEYIELGNAETDEEIIEEMADVIEVMHAISARLTTQAALDRTRTMKRTLKGGFEEGYVMQVDE